MTVNIDQTIEKNEQLLDELRGLLVRRFLGPGAIRRLAFALIDIVTHYQRICLMLARCAGRPGGDGHAGD